MTMRYTREQLDAASDAFNKGYALGRKQRLNGEWITGTRSDFDGPDKNFNSFVNGHQAGYNNADTELRGLWPIN